jgi:hypothetical protein
MLRRVALVTSQKTAFSNSAESFLEGDQETNKVGTMFRSDLVRIGSNSSVWILTRGSKIQPLVSLHLLSTAETLYMSLRNKPSLLS